MSWALLANAKAIGSSNPTTPAIDTTGADLLIYRVASWGSAAYPSIADNKGNTWNVLQATSGDIDSQFAWSVPTTVGAGHTVTATGASLFGSVMVAAFSGAHATPHDQELATIKATAAFIQTGALTPSEANSLIIAALGSGNGATAHLIDSGFVTIEQQDYVGGLNYGGGIAYLDQGSPAAAVNPTWSWTTNGASASHLVIFKSAGGGGGGGSDPSPIARAGDTLRPIRVDDVPHIGGVAIRRACLV